MTSDIIFSYYEEFGDNYIEVATTFNNELMLSISDGFDAIALPEDRARLLALNILCHYLPEEVKL